MKKFLISAVFLSLTCVLSGCGRDDANRKNEEQEGSYSLNLSPTGDVIYKNGQQGSELFEIPDIADFKVLVYNSKNEQYASFAKFSEMPSPARLKEGEYTIVASHGANPPAAFNAPYFEGRAPFSIIGTGNTPLQLTCKVANVLIGVQYTDKFKAVFDNYSLDVMTEYTVNEEGEYESLRFTGDDSRIGFVRVAPVVYLSVSVRKKDTDKTYRYGATPLKDVKGGEYYKLVFDSDARGNATVSITLNDETQSKPLDVTLGEEYLPKLPPRINTTFNAEIPYGFRYGFFDAKSPVTAAVTAQGGVKNLILEVNSDFAAQKGIPSTVDFSEITPETEASLKEIGIECGKSIIGTTSGRIGFTKMLSKLSAIPEEQGTEHAFKIKVIDSYDREYTKDLSFEVLPLTIKMGAVNDYDIWAKHAKFGVAAIEDVTAEEQAKNPVKYEVSVEGGEWKELSSFTIADGYVAATDLSDNTEYKVRAAVKGVYSNEVSFTTEEAKNVPNASFEETYDEKFASKTESVIYYPYAKDEANPFWQTLNPMTTRDKKENYYQSYPCALVVSSASHGSKAMKLYSVGWGGNSKAPGSILGTPNPTSITPGKLFIGDYVDYDGDWDNGNQHMNQGKSFTSRPASVDFDYKYDYYDALKGNCVIQARVSIENRTNGVTTVLATGSFELKTKSSIGSYTTQNMALTYTNTTLKATHISMSFQPDEDGGIIITGLKTINENGSKKTVGSALYIDNIVLKY